MNRTYRKTVVRTIRKSFSRFIAIFAIVALGVGFLAGLLATTPDMRYSADRFFDESNLFDLRIVGTLGLTDEDVKAVQAVEGVEQVMPAYTADSLVQTPGGDTLVARVQSVPLDQIEQKEPTGYINHLKVFEGRLPVKEDECVVEKGTDLHGIGIAVGDTLTLCQEGAARENPFARDALKVVGVVDSSEYFSIEPESATVGKGTVDVVLYTGDQNFALPAWTDLYVTIKGAKEYSSLTQAYSDYVQGTAEKVEEISGARSRIRYEQVKSEAQQKLEEATQEYDSQSRQAQEKLEQAQAQLTEGGAQIDSSQKELENAKQQIASGQVQLEQNKQALPGTLTEKQQQLTDGKTQLIEAKAQYEQGTKEAEVQQQALQNGKQQLEQAKKMVTVMEPVVESARQALPPIEQQVQQLAQQAQSAQQLAAQLDETAKAAEQQRDQAADQRAAAQTALEQAQAQIDAARGEMAEEEWAAQNPQQAEPLLQTREEAALAVQAADAALEPLNLAAEQARSRADAASQQAETANALLEQANSALAQAQKTLADAQQQLDGAKTQIAENEPKIAQGQQQLEQAKEQLSQAAAQITEAEKQIAQGETALQLAPDLAKLQLDLAQQQLEDSQTQVSEGEQQLMDAKQELAQGQKEYNEQKKQVEEKLADARSQLEEARQQIEELQVPQWYVLTRSQNMSFASLNSNVQKVEAIARVFPIFFFLVAALVALTTMTRMVEEERVQIGTMKALGYSKRSIMAKYVIYAMTATVMGCMFGLTVGFRLFPTVIWNAYSMMYELPKLYCLFHVPYAAVASGAAIFCTLAATLNACWATLMEVPAALLLPKAPKAGKRILLERVRPVWKRMKFTHKVTARNLFRYKKRFFMTVIGIAGCTGLLVTGFGLHDSISDIVNRQFGSIFTYDVTVSVKKPEKLAESSLEGVLNNGTLVEDWMQVHQEISTNEFGGESFETYLFVPQQPEQLSRFVDLHRRVGGDPVAFSQDGIVITEKMSERAHLSVGDEVTLKNKDGKKGTFRVDGVVENYVENYVYLSAETYEKEFGASPVFDMVVAHAADKTQQGREALSEALLQCPQVAGMRMIQDLKQTFSNMMQKIDIIVVVLIVSAGVLAFVVLYNLTNINITERTKEIATIKVLGFYDREVSAYVYRESVVLSVIGTLAGLVLGIFLHMFVIHSVEVDAVMFGRTIKPLSYVFSALLTLLFSFLVNLVMHRKLRRISMVESMKAPE